MEGESSDGSAPSVTDVIEREISENYSQFAQYGIGFVNAIAGAASLAEVLVIDDDEIMRDLVADWLEAAGYAVR